MESTEDRLNAEGKAHAPERKALRKYSLSRLFSGLWEAVSWISFLWIGFLVGHKHSVDNTFEWAMVAFSLFLAFTALFRFFTARYLMRRSMLYTCPGYVMYVKKVWRPFSRVRFTAYRIDHIRDQRGADNEIPSTVKGKIQVVSLDESGKPMDAPRFCRKVKLPPIFEDKEEIYEALNEIQSATDRAEGRALLPWLNNHTDHITDGGRE